MMIQSILAFKWFVGLRCCQDMLERRCLNLVEIAVKPIRNRGLESGCSYVTPPRYDVFRMSCSIYGTTKGHMSRKVQKVGKVGYLQRRINTVVPREGN